MDGKVFNIIQGIQIKNFGAFCFEVASEKVLPAQLVEFDIRKSLFEQREERKHVHKIRFDLFIKTLLYS